MIDLVSLVVRAGNGGDGKVSFRREKYVPKGGPDGGIGGNGGDVLVRANAQLSTVTHLSGVHEITAQPGSNGGRKKQRGPAGENQIIEVPVGTVIWGKFENSVGQLRRLRYSITERMKREDAAVFRYFLEKEGQHIPAHPHPDLLPEEAETWRIPKATKFSPKDLGLRKLFTFEHPDDEVLLCQGGFGGRGNVQFKSSRLTTPLVAEYGTPGEQRTVVFELKLLADVGLVGYPNAGKSTLLSVLTEASPKIGSYPFTTLEPQLGMIRHNGKEVVLADIPGIIEGASQGKGLGFDFLRHIDNTKMLLYVVSLLDDSAHALTAQEQVSYLKKQFDQLRAEVKEYNPELLDKPSLLVLAKTDVYSEELRAILDKEIKSISQTLPVLQISAASREGLDSLKTALTQ